MVGMKLAGVLPPAWCRSLFNVREELDDDSIGLWGGYEFTSVSDIQKNLSFYNDLTTFSRKLLNLFLKLAKWEDGTIFLCFWRLDFTLFYSQLEFPFCIVETPLFCSIPSAFFHLIKLSQMRLTREVFFAKFSLWVLSLSFSISSHFINLFVWHHLPPISFFLHLPRAPLPSPR